MSQERAPRLESSEPSWKDILARYQTPRPGRALWEVLTSFGPYLALWPIMYWSLGVSYWLTLLLAVLAGGFLIRVFIIFHDCGHGSFSRNRRLNEWVGFFAGVLTFTPYHYWNHQHARHHATAGNLDRRGLGDVWMLTLREYREASFGLKLGYRLFRNPFVMFLLGPVFMFLISHRLAPLAVGWRWHRGVIATNLALVGIAVSMSFWIGLEAYLRIQIPAILVAGVGGIWLFYVQHQFEGVYWAREGEWDYTKVALTGSSYYALPRVLQWFSGHIGFHHVHHLGPRIPSYLLERCHRENAIFRNVKPLTVRESLRCVRLRVYDEEAKKMVPLGPAYL